MTKKAYFVVDSDNIDGDGINYHLFDGTVTIENGRRVAVRLERTSMCGNADKTANTYLSICNNQEELRIKTAELQNNGDQVCGQCVATLYADDTD